MSLRPIARALAILAICAMIIGVWWTQLSRRAVAQNGKVTISTEPAGAEVSIDGQVRGATPLTLTIAHGAHTLVVSGSATRTVPLNVPAGGEVAQFFELPAPRPAAPLAGAVEVITDPPGASVAVDGRQSGKSPVNVANLEPGDHKVVVSGSTGTAERTVTAAAGVTTSVVFALPKSSAPVGGWLAVSTPFDLQLTERGTSVGSVGRGGAKTMLAAGRHTLAVDNAALGYHTTSTIEVPAGKTATLRIDAPKVMISVNARPWADVLLDGASVGQTPIANLQVSIGSHEMIFRHPQRPERRQTIVVTAKGPNRFAADLTQ